MAKFAPVLALLLLVAGAVGGAASGTSGQIQRSQLKALETLVSRPIPARNLYQLADQLTLRPPRPIRHVVRTTSPNYAVGHSDDFWVLSEDKLAYFKLHATIMVETPHLYIYVQNGLKVDKTAIQKSAHYFEYHTYPTDRSFFGSEWTPGVDGDPHVTCLIGNLESAGAAGFYSAEDEYPRLVNPYSNVREMFYINTNTLPGQGGFDVTLAHEFQHMIHWHTHPRDNAWLNEGMSMVAQHVDGFPDSTAGEADSFLGDPTTQLNTWPANTDDTTSHYGASYLFLIYLYDRFGRGILHDLVADKQYTDFELLNDVLHKDNIHETADQIFADWVAANAVDDPKPAHGIYAYRDLPYNVSASSILTLPVTYHGTVQPYAAQYLDFPNVAKLAPFRLQFAASPIIPLVGLPGSSTTAIEQSGPYWWSNRGDLSDTRLVRSADLTHVRHAHLLFQTWYNIENTYDYGFIEASADNGKTWTTLPGTHTQTSNPTGANFGNGYTGDSKAWLNESVNLSRYHGRRIELRFEYITDDETNLQGMAIRNIRIPEIGLHSTFSGWQAHGFLPVQQNALPSHWSVQLLETTSSGTQVAHMPISAAGTGSLLIDPARDHITKLNVIVFTAAPKTTVKTTYQLTTASAQS